MEEILLEYHYKILLKLDYFVLGIDIALLGWTVVNTDWVPRQILFVWLMFAFWFLVIFSIIFGIIRQLNNAGAFGINSKALHSARLAGQIERSVMEGGSFKDQQTGEVISSEEFAKFGVKHRENENEAKKLFKKLSKCSEYFGNAAILFLVLSLLLLVLIKILSFLYF